MARRALVGPEVADAATLSSLLARLGHYFAGVGARRIAIALGPSLDEATAVELLRAPSLPSGMHPDVLSRLADIAQAIRFVDHHRLAAAVAGTDVVLLHDVRARDGAPWSDILAGYRPNRTSFDVDWIRTRADGIAFADAARVVGSRTRTFDADSAARFRHPTQHLVAGDALLVGTGPSARDVLTMDVPDGMRVVCNTIVLDDEVMDHVAPQFVTCADPVFHFGPSAYAYRFREALLRQSRRHDFLVVTVERYAPLLRSLCPSLTGRVIGVRLGSPKWPQNLDLRTALAVRPYPNVLTMLMLPLGATFARTIHLVGFDGRDPNETYFWRHGASVQLEDAIADVAAAHPGFFELDYADYYREHVNAVEAVIAAHEREGGTVVARTASYIPALARRTVASPVPAVRRWLDREAAPDRSNLVVSVTPDWVGDFGHFGPWERALRRGASGDGTSVLTLASKALITDDASVVPAFTHGTLRGVADMAVFDHELQDALAELTGRGRRVTVAFYTADVWHLPSLLAVAVDHPDVTIVANLMRVHAAVEGAIAAGDDPLPVSLVLLRDCLVAARDTNLVVCVDTEALADDVEALLGVRPVEWPMVIVSDPDSMARAVRGAGPHDPNSVHVVAAIQTQVGKGFREVVDLAEDLAPKLRRGRIVLTTRFVQPPDRGLAEDRRRAERFRHAGGVLVEGDLDDEEYAALIGGADVVLLPYHADTFRTRTSAVVLDAAAAGKPIVVPHGTWAATVVERFGIGVTYDDRNRRGVVRAIGKAAKQLDELTAAVESRREKVLGEFAPHRLVEFLLEARRSDMATPDVHAVSRVRELRAALVSESQAAARDRRRIEIDQHVALDEVRRAHDDTRDRLERRRRTARHSDARVESLREGLRWRQDRIDRLESRPGFVIDGASRRPSDRVYRLRKATRRQGGRALRRVGIDPAVVKQRWPWIDRL